jgi:hypothetical protein
LILLLIVEGYYRGYRNPEQEKHLRATLQSLIAARGSALRDD